MKFHRNKQTVTTGNYHWLSLLRKYVQVLLYSVSRKANWTGQIIKSCWPIGLCADKQASWKKEGRPGRPRLNGTRRYFIVKLVKRRYTAFHRHLVMTPGLVRTQNYMLTIIIRPIQHDKHL